MHVTKKIHLLPNTYKPCNFSVKIRVTPVVCLKQNLRSVGHRNWIINERGFGSRIPGTVHWILQLSPTTISPYIITWSIFSCTCFNLLEIFAMDELVPRFFSFFFIFYFRSAVTPKSIFTWCFKLTNCKEKNLKPHYFSIEKLYMTWHLIFHSHMLNFGVTMCRCFLFFGHL